MNETSRTGSSFESAQDPDDSKKGVRPPDPVRSYRRRVSAVVHARLRRESAVMFQEKQPAPSERGQHEENTDVVGEMSQAMIVLQPIQHGQDIVPVMHVSFLSSYPAKQHEIHRPRVIDIWGDIHEAFRRPPKSH